MKIKHKLVAAMTATTLVPVLLLSAYSIEQAREQARARFADISARQLEAIDSQFSSFFADIARNVEFLARAPQLRAADASLSTYYDGPEQLADAAAQGGVEAEIYHLFERFADTHPGFAYVYMGTREGGYVQWPKGKVTAHYDPRQRPWYQKAQQTPGQVALSGAYYWAADDATLMGVVRTFDNAAGERYGVMAMDVSLSALTEMARQARLGERGYLMLIEDTGTVLVDAANPEHNFKAVDSLPGSAYRALAVREAGLADVELGGEAFAARVHRSAALGWTMIALMPQAEIMAPANRIMWTTLGITALVLLGVVALAFWLAGLLVRPIVQVGDGLREIAEGGGDLTRRLSVTSRDETGQLAHWFNQFLESIQQLVGQINHRSRQMQAASEEGSRSAAAVDRASEHQLTEVESMMTAATQMSATADEVARSCARTADAAAAGQAASDNGKAVMSSTEQSVRALGEQVTQSVAQMRALEAETGRINSVLDVIREIADQTNLLALNAAIEAARAGSQGRGFAVVADEVRTLAQRTQVSTEEINDLLQRLNHQTHQVVETMAASQERSQQAVALTAEAHGVFDQIKQAVDQINDMATQIASAAEEQHQVSAGINVNIEAIHGAANEVNRVSSAVADNADRQARLARELNGLVDQFRI